MSEKKIIAVVGATGAQGGGLVQAILADPNSEFSVRAITRDINSDKAKALAAQGAEVVAADLHDPQSLLAAFKGSYGVFGVTFFWNHFSPTTEKQEAKNIAEAAKEAGVQHVVWSTLEDTRNWVPLSDNRMPTLMDEYKVPHFDAKGESNHFFSDLELPVTFMLTSFYWDNLLNPGMAPQKGADGKLAFNLPMGDKKLPGIGAADIGKSAYGIFKAGQAYIGKTVGIAGDHLTGAQMAQALSQTFGQEIAYNAVPFEIYRNLGFPGADDLGNMFQFKHDFETDFCAARNLDESRQLNPDIQTFAQWLTQHKAQIPLG